MKQIYGKKTFIFLQLIFLFTSVQAQTIVKGSVTEKSSGWLLFGANITVKDKLVGTISDLEGNFELKTQMDPPFVLVVSSVGYAPQEFEITDAQTELKVELETTISSPRM